MSYILDALKKAERERDAAQIPTLTTVHDAPSAQSRKLVWLILGACFACTALIVGIRSFPVKHSPVPAAPETSVRSVAEETTKPPISIHETGITAEGDLASETQQPKNPSSGMSARNPAAELKHPPAARQIENKAEVPPAQAKESSPPQVPSVTPAPEVKETPPASATPSPKMASLREAVSKMTMTILSYAEAKSERMVFINDHRYYEGECVDGLYLIESITPEGAWLTYQGERSILRPKSK